MNISVQVTNQRASPYKRVKRLRECVLMGRRCCLICARCTNGQLAFRWSEGSIRLYSFKVHANVQIDWKKRYIKAVYYFIYLNLICLLILSRHYHVQTFWQKILNKIIVKQIVIMRWLGTWKAKFWTLFGHKKLNEGINLISVHHRICWEHQT